jgi:hypothetical protein
VVITDQVPAELRLGAGRRGARQAGVGGQIAHQPGGTPLLKERRRLGLPTTMLDWRLPGITARQHRPTPKKIDWHAGQLRI